MLPAREKTPTNWLNAIGRSLLKRLESPIQFCEKRIINNMENLYRVIRKGDVVLVEGCSEMSRIIQILTQSSWSHAAFYVGDALEGSGIEGVKKSLDESESDLRDKRINNPYGSELIMRHYSQIAPRDFDLSPNFEIVKYNIFGMAGFDYNLIWAGKGDPL